jgi:uncharacterized membrane-anchored protein
MADRRDTGWRRVMAKPVRTLVAIGVVLLLVGIVVSVAADASTVGLVVGLVSVGLGAVALISAVFYAVGRSEDEDRARHPMG